MILKFGEYFEMDVPFEKFLELTAYDKESIFIADAKIPLKDLRFCRTESLQETAWVVQFIEQKFSALLFEYEYDNLIGIQSPEDFHISDNLYEDKRIKQMFQEYLKDICKEQGIPVFERYTIHFNNFTFYKYVYKSGKDEKTFMNFKKYEIETLMELAKNGFNG